jgi:mRNA interferase RelE/StbE
MIIEFDRSFSKSLDKVKDASILNRVERTILQLEKANSLLDIPNVKKLTGFKDYFRIRLGDYRLGLERIDNHTVRLIIITHRKDIYKVFP